jgi:hypothetical protein
MTELSNAVTVLIARMESHPEDFGVADGRIGRPKFNDVANALYGLVGMDKEMAGAYWFLTDADKEALIEAWKKRHRVAMEKEVMEKIFDDGAEEREAEARRSKQATQRAQINTQMATIGTQARSQQQTAMNAAQNSSGNYNSGLLGATGSAFSGLFGGSR